MKTTKELFGNVPRAVWKMQYKLAVKRINLADEHLRQMIDRRLEFRDHNAEASVIKAKKFWEAMRDEAMEEIKLKAQKLH